MGREESGGKRARRKFDQGCAPKGSYHTGGEKATCRGDEAALGGQARGFGGKEDGTQTARHEENGVKIDSMVHAVDDQCSHVLRAFTGRN